VAVGRGAVWVANSGEGTVSRIDPASNRVVATVRIAPPDAMLALGCSYGTSAAIHQTPHGSFTIRACDLPRAVAVAPGAVWAAKNDDESIVRIDPATNRIVARVSIHANAWYIAATATAVWISDWNHDLVVHVDPVRNEVVASIPDLPHGPSGIAIAGDSVWVANSRADVITRIDARSGRIAATVPVSHTPLPVAYAYGSIWVRNAMSEGNGSVSRIDPASNRVLAEIPVRPVAGRDGLDSLGIAPNGLWVAGLFLERIDPAQNRVVERRGLTANAVTYGEGSLWLTDIGYSVTRVQA
jgi:YVTN family beta-propeller protein